MADGGRANSGMAERTNAVNHCPQDAYVHRLRDVPSGDEGGTTMQQAHTDDKVLPYPKSRRFLEAAMRSTRHKPMIHGLLEVDVTDARAFLRDHHDRTGESLSFTAFIISCLARAVDENKAVHALRLGSSRIMLFADVDVLTWVEREAEGQQFIVPYI